MESGIYYKTIYGLRDRTEGARQIDAPKYSFRGDNGEDSKRVLYVNPKYNN